MRITCHNCAESFERSGGEIWRNLLRGPICPACQDPAAREQRALELATAKPIASLAGPPREITDDIRAVFLAPAERYRRLLRVLRWAFLPPIALAILWVLPIVLAEPFGWWQFHDAEIVFEPLDSGRPNDARVRFTSDDGELVERMVKLDSDEAARLDLGADGLVEVAYADVPPQPPILLAKRDESFDATFRWLNLVWGGVVLAAVLLWWLTGLFTGLERWNAERRLRIFEHGVLTYPVSLTGAKTMVGTRYTVRCHGWRRARSISVPDGTRVSIGNKMVVCYLEDRPSKCIVVPADVIRKLPRLPPAASDSRHAAPDAIVETH